MISGENRLCYCPKSTGSLDRQPKCFSSAQSLNRIKLFVTPWIVPCQASLSITISWSLLKLRSIESETPSNHYILCRPLLLLPSIFPSISVFSNSWPFASGGQSIGASISASVLQRIPGTGEPGGLQSIGSHRVGHD